jgi:inward rectifier potassium channel
MAKRRAKRSRRPRVRHPPGLNLIQVGAESHPLADLYHLFLRTSWPAALGFLAAAFIAVNALFALAYTVCGGCVEGARPGSFADAFFFSVQTIATIGYGQMVPRTGLANLMVSAEAFSGLLGIAIVTGLVFSKFSRPTARVLFSKVAVIAPRNGMPCLMFRMANERANRIVEANVHVVLARNETTQEGEQMRRMHDLRLDRERSALFAITWTVVHPIAPDSPFHGATPESLAAEGAEVVVSMTGLDETLSQTVYARHSYAAAEIICNARFVDIFSRLDDGTPRIDYTHFHDWVPLEDRD